VSDARERPTDTDGRDGSPGEDVAWSLLDSVAVGEIAAFGSPMAVEAGQMLYRAGGDPPNFFVVLDGEIEIVREGEDEVVIAAYGPGGFAGELNLLTGQRPYLSARVSRAGRVLSVPPEKFRQLLDTKPELSDTIFRARRRPPRPGRPAPGPAGRPQRPPRPPIGPGLPSGAISSWPKTLWPAENRVAPSPTCSTTPAPSAPSIIGKVAGMGRQSPLARVPSMGFMPAALSLISTWPALGRGVGTSASAGFVPYSLTTTARIVLPLRRIAFPISLLLGNVGLKQEPPRRVETSPRTTWSQCCAPGRSLAVRPPTRQADEPARRSICNRHPKPVRDSEMPHGSALAPSLGTRAGTCAGDLQPDDGNRAKPGGCNGQSFCRTASISRLILILSPTTTPPPSSGMLNSIPKSARLISVPAENPARVPP
jgi:Cyclic nucleotide-binding domain